MTRKCTRESGYLCPIEAEDLSDSDDDSCPLGNVVKIKCCVPIPPDKTLQALEDIENLIIRNGQRGCPPHQTITEVMRGISNIRSLVIKRLY